MICIEGIIIPANWDSNGNVTGLAIATCDEEEYLIADNDQVARLKPFLRKEVELRGSLQILEGRRIIKVERFKIMKSTVDPVKGDSLSATPTT